MTTATVAEGPASLSEAPNCLAMTTATVADDPVSLSEAPNCLAMTTATVADDPANVANDPTTPAKARRKSRRASRFRSPHAAGVRYQVRHLLMKQTYENDFSMFSTVRDFMNLHTADTTGVPAIPTVVTALSSLITQIDAAATTQAAPLTGIADDKEAVRTTLEEAVFIVSEPLSALAAAANNNTLHEEVSISRTGLDRLSAENLDIWATRVAARATTNPTLYAGYRAARVIVDRHGGGGTPTPPLPGP